MRLPPTAAQPSIASLNEQWNGPDWLPPDIRVGIVFVNLTHPPDGVVCFLHKITDILLEQLVPLQYDDLERKMRDLQDEMATACDESNAKNQAFDEWKSVASNEGWEGIVADELLIDVRIVDSNM
ncbi:hypothetical protein AU210_014414 [Fusarium oxysporum f. sp. radicis-cucumerinum]|uniref:Uncharacterized protein n=1 Tax=Fusarium oxysporum f. sp. radicis-cucumerinum TaxID=327505 RepID=A0A2H3G310_FUSOX|nr:hypothetical protein AU210_014414 [Fusarium oxysporum f. sp. radicis-cucumerinum]